MKFLPLLMITVLSIALVPTGRAQSSGASKTDPQNGQTKQQRKGAKAKPSAAKSPVKAHTTKKTTTTQDVAYAAAYKAGTPK